jgi:hypothetical protein
MTLRSTLRWNALSCLSFGTLFALAPGAVASFLAHDPAPEWLVRIVGLVLVLNGAHLLWAARAGRVRPLEVLYFSAGDVLWVLGTLILIASGLWVQTLHGVVIAAVVAVMVATFAVLQVRTLPRCSDLRD